jgi:large subunit ribosomal protein L13
MDMNKSFVLTTEARAPKWHVIDASGKVLGRLCTEVATILRGKDKPEFTPHTDSGDYVIVTNCDKIVLTGNKWKGKTYKSFSGYRGGLKTQSALEVFKKDPCRLVVMGVKGMLPKNTLNRAVIKKLKTYAGSEHPHKAQFRA